MATPWDLAETLQVAEVPGGEVGLVSTAGHGGFWVSGSALEAMAAIWPDFRPWAHGKATTLATLRDLGAVTWFEEDCDSALVVLAFPELFDVDDQRWARRVVHGSAGYFTAAGCGAGSLPGAEVAS